MNRDAAAMMEQDAQRRAQPWKTDASTQALAEHVGARNERVYLDSNDATLSVTIHPMEIRTFVCDFTRG